jgi:Ca2+-binding EF-hand superfamily protein
MNQVRKDKLSKLFHCWDTDTTGFIEKADWIRILQRRSAVFGWNDEAYQSELGQVLTSFDMLRRFADTDQDGKISRDEFMAFFGQMVGESSDVRFGSLPPMMQVSLTRYAAEMDTDQDGQIDRADYVRWYTQIMGGTAETAEQAFGKLDRNGDGLLSLDELKQATAEFYLSDDATAPGTWLFG